MHLLPPFLTLSVPSPTSSQKRRERERERENCRNRSVPPQTQIKHKYLSIQARRTDKNQAWVCISIRFFFFFLKVNIYVDIFSFTPRSYLIFDTSTFQFRIFFGIYLDFANNFINWQVLQTYLKRSISSLWNSRSIARDWSFLKENC